MIIYLYLFILPLFLSVESSSIRGRNNKNELVPLMSSGVDTLEKNNNLKVVSNEPFIIQLHVPKHNDSKSTREKDKKRKRPAKKRVSKLRKKHRTRRDLTSRLTKRSREEKSQAAEVPIAVNATEIQIKNTTKNSINRVEILKALSSYSRKKQNKSSEPEEHGGDADDTKRTHPFSDKSPIVKMIYPSTPKLDRHSHKYTYKDLMADRKRLEQKINYIKNMFSANDSTTDDAVRIRRRTESDRTANKIAKMFLTLSAVNGLHDRRRTRCKDDDDDGDRVQDIWEKEQRSSPNRKASSSNAERYKVKKWIEFMKNKRSSGKTCPCMASLQGDDSDAFPLEQKLPKDYFLMERSRSSEESSETYRDPFYNSRDRSFRKKYSKDTPENNLRALSKNGKKKLDLPLSDLELYRSRAKQILQNAEEILDKIKEEEERRLSAPSILMSQLKELTSRIQSDPRNNENDLIRKMQKSLGWKPLAKAKEGNSFIDNVKAYILDPYEKAKALTDESAKTLSSYLLRNLGKMQESSEELEAKQSADETGDKNDNPQVFFGQVPTKEEEKPLSASLAKEDSRPDLLSKAKQELQNWEDTISTIMQGPDEADQKGPSSTQGKLFKNRMEDIIKEQQKKLDDYEALPRSEENREADGDDNRNPTGKKTKPGIKFTKPEKHSLGGHKQPLRLKPKEGNDKDKTDKLKNLPGNHLKGISKVPLPKAPKLEKDTLGKDKHPFRLKPKEGIVYEHGKPVKQIGNHQKHPIHSHLRAHTKGGKTALPKASEDIVEENSEDPEKAASKETEELGKEILEEIVETLENDKILDSAGEESETADPQAREMLKTVAEDSEEPKLQQAKENEEEVGNANETPLQVSLNEEERDLEDESAVLGEQRQDGNLGKTISEKPKMTNGRQDIPGQPYQSGSESLSEDENQPDREVPNVNLPASRHPPDYDLLSGDDDETPAKVSDNLKEAVEEALEDLSGPTNEETLVQKPETVINAKDSEGKSEEDNLEAVIDPLLRKAEQLETELIKEESDLENKSNEDNLQAIDPLLKTAEQLESELTGKKSDLENKSAEDNLEDVIDPLLQMAQQLETELEENKSTEDNVELTDTVSSKDGTANSKTQDPSNVERVQDDVETQQTDPDSVQAANRESREKPGRTANENKYKTESSQSDEEDETDPLNLKLERQDAKNSRPVEQDGDEVRATLNQEDDEESSEEVGKSESEEDDDSPVQATLKTQENSEERPDENLRAVLEEESSEIDKYAPLKAAKSEGQGNDSMEDSDETPLKEALENADDDGESSLREALENKEDEDDDEDDDDESSLRRALKKEEDTPVKKTLESKEDKEKDEESRSRKALNKEKEDKYDNPLRKSLGSSDNNDEIPLRKTLESKEGEEEDDDDDVGSLSEDLKEEDKYDTPSGNTLGSKAEDDVETPLKKASKEQEDKYDTSLRKNLESEEKEDEFPLRKSLGNKEDEHDDDDDDDNETPLRKTLESKEDDEDENDSPLREALEKQEDNYEDPLGRSLKKEEEKKDEEESALNKQDRYGNPLGKRPGNTEDKEEETPLRKTLQSEEDDVAEDETPLRKTTKNKQDEQDGDASADDEEETPLRKIMKSKGDASTDDNDDTPLRKAMKNIKDRGDDGDDETPLRKTMENKEDDDVSASEDEETSLRKTMNEDEQVGDDSADGDETPLRKTMENQGASDVSVDDDETPLRKTMKNQDDRSDDDDHDEIPLRKTMKNKVDEDEGGNDETPLRNPMRTKDEQNGDASVDDNDDETPLGKTMENKDEQEDDVAADDDETPLRKTLENKEHGEDESPLRNALENKKYEDDDNDDTAEDETTLREALENQKEKDETLQAERSTEEADNLPSSKTKAEVSNDQSVLKEANTQTEGTSASEEETPLRETMKQKNQDPQNHRTVSSEENKSEGDEQNELEDTRGETPLQATPNEQENKLDAENSEETPLLGVNPDQEEQNGNDPDTQNSAEFKSSKARDEENLQSADPTIGEQQKEDDEGYETSEEVAVKRKDDINPEVDGESLLKSVEDPGSLEAGITGANLRAENPDEQTSGETPLRSALNDESFEDSQEKTNDEPSLREEKQESQSEETSQEKSGEALRLALENLVEDKKENEDDESPLKAEKSIGKGSTKDPQSEDESAETLRASLSNEASEEGDGETVKEAETETPVEQTLKGSKQEAYLKKANPIKTGTVSDQEERSRNDEPFEDPQNSEETPLRVSLNQEDTDEGEAKTENSSDEDTENPLRSASLENELDSNIRETPLKSAKPMDEIQEGPNSEETVRAEDTTDETHNQIDGTENEDETPLKSAKLEESNEDDSAENSLETLREDNPLGEDNNPEGSDSRENRQQSSLPALLQMPEKSPKTGKLKVPKSIAQIMKDLDGRQKDDITSLQNLNPDKIDDIIGKIGEAEQQNLLEHPDVDCRKECACADEIDTRSRNIGRYEIVKDFLHWMKDLQLNRVLTDD